MSSRTLAMVSVAALAASIALQVDAQDYAWDPDDVEVRRSAFLNRVVATHGFDQATINEILESAEIRQSALNAISRPAERVIPWYEYREIFMNAARIEAGAEFWRQNEALVAATSERFGVDPEYIIAILGIESLYGDRMGSYRVIDALTTLAFAYPPRADFFASELEAFLLIHAEEGPSVLEGLGSYAGAMGAGQFIPSSYRAYAVDADGDGRRDLWTNWNDILGSIANYLASHGWRDAESVAVPAEPGTGPAIEPSNRLLLDSSVAELRSRGYEFDQTLAGDARAMVVAVEASADDTAYYIGLNNFHVITRYNRSVKYALAAVELAEAIRREYQAGGSPDAEASSTLD